MPEGALIIPNFRGAEQGFLLDGKESAIAYLPFEKSEHKVMIEKYVIPFLENRYGLKNKRMTLKYCGDKEKLLKTLAESKQIADCDYEYFVKEKDGDVTVNLLFGNYAEQNAMSVIRYVVSVLSDDIYAEQEVSLSERLFDLLKLKKLRLSVAESFTGGRIVADLIKNSGASEILTEGIVAYSNQSKIDRLGVKIQDLNKYGAVSSEVAYQMALGLLRKDNCDVAIATTGIAGPKSDDTAKPVGLNYIAIGTKQGIHTYKFNLSGDRERITETAKNYALFLAIKNFKKYNEDI